MFEEAPRTFNPHINQHAAHAKVTSNNPEETFQIGKETASRLKPGAVIALHGGLGAGKTCFVQGLAAGLGIDAVVNSPTYTIINEYPGTPTLYHIDLYRASSENEVLGLGLEEYFDSADAITAVEWPERAGSILEDKVIDIQIECGLEQEQRVITIKGLD